MKDKWDEEAAEVARRAQAEDYSVKHKPIADARVAYRAGITDAVSQIERVRDADHAPDGFDTGHMWRHGTYKVCIGVIAEVLADKEQPLQIAKRNMTNIERADEIYWEFHCSEQGPSDDETLILRIAAALDDAELRAAERKDET